MIADTDPGFVYALNEDGTNRMDLSVRRGFFRQPESRKDYIRITDEELYANARLIAAAPDLLAGLKDVMGWIKNWDVPFDEDREWHQSKQDIEAAILKAEGGQP